MRNLGKINGVDVEISDHALARLCEMQVPGEEIAKILFEPDESFESTKYPGDTCYTRGDYALATCTRDGVLIIKTALYSCRAAWVQAWLDGKLSEEREKKLLSGDINVRLWASRG